MVIPIAFDVTCRWCYLATHQTRRLSEEFGVSFDWQGFELYPEPMPFPEAPPPAEPPFDRPKPPSRFAVISAAEEVKLPEVSRVKNMRSHNALEAIEAARAAGVPHQEFVERVFYAYWHEGRDLSDLDQLLPLCEEFGLPPNVRQMIESRAYSDKIVPFDEPAYAKGVRNTPTYVIGEERLAEVPLETLRAAIQRYLVPPN